MPFQGQVAVVTGGSRGIGKAIAIELARLGSDIVVNYFRHHQEARDTATEIEAMGVKCLIVRAHMGDETQVRKLFSTVEKQFGRMDILINNAASGVQRSALDLESKHWDWTMDINAKAPWLCARQAASLMDKGGSIINITSMGSQRVLPYYMAIGVSKAALESLTRYLAVELAPKGISVNAISGGYVDTASLRQFPNWEEMLSMARDKTPAARMVTPEDIAAAVVFLCSPHAAMIRGQVIVVDGGMTLL